MKITPYYSPLIAAGLFGVARAEFQEISSIPDSTVMGIRVSPKCTGKSPNTMFTVEPADALTISADPPNLVTASVVGTELQLEFNSDVAATASSGGVKIGAPSTLSYVSVGSASQLQIYDGFTSMTEIEVSGASGVSADLSSNAVPLNLQVTGASGLTVTTPTSVSGGEVSGASEATIGASLVEGLRVTGASAANIDGGMTGGSVSGASSVTATGDASGVNASGASSISAKSCINVISSGASQCSVATTTVDASVAAQPETLSGNNPCGWGGLSSIFGGSSGSSNVNSCRTGLVAVVAAAVYMVV